MKKKAKSLSRHSHSCSTFLRISLRSHKACTLWKGQHLHTLQRYPLILFYYVYEYLCKFLHSSGSRWSLQKPLIGWGTGTRCEEQSPVACVVSPPQQKRDLDFHTGHVQTRWGILPRSHVCSFLHEPTRGLFSPSTCECPSGLSCVPGARGLPRPPHTSFPVHPELTAAFSCVCMRVVLLALLDGSAVTSKPLIAISKKPNINTLKDTSFFF